MVLAALVSVPVGALRQRPAPPRFDNGEAAAARLPTKRSFDVVYLLTAHESPECVRDAVRNILHFNRSIDVGVVINGSPDIDLELTQLVGERVGLVPCAKRRSIYTFDILEAYLDAGEWCWLQALRVEYVVVLASNCIFWRDVDLPEIAAIEQSGVPSVGNSVDSIVDISRIGDVKVPWDNWPNILANRRIVDDLRAVGVTHLLQSQFEGTAYKFRDFMEMRRLITFMGIKQKIKKQTVFEEFLPATLYKMITKRDLASVCRVFWELPQYRPSVKDIQAQRLPCVKRVERKLDDPVRRWLRESTSDYSGSAL